MFIKLFVKKSFFYNLYVYLWSILLVNLIVLWSYYNFSLNVSSIFINLGLFYTVYWFFSVFIFLIKKSYLGKFSSILQRFWKRSFMLFWSIEIFLFFIYLFLVCNSPEETLYVLDFNKLNKILLIQLNELLFKTLILLYINLILYSYILLLKNSKKNFFIYIFIWFHYLIYIEYQQLFYFSNYFNNYTYIYDTDEKIWSADIEMLKTRPFYFYIYIFVILKYWHIFFIYYYMIIAYWSISLLYSNSYNWISSLYQNFFYIYIFNYIYLFIFFKKFSKYLGSIEYLEFYINQNLYNLYLYDYLVYFNIDYYIYLL